MMTANALPKELQNRLLRTVPLLKRWAANPERTSHSIASELGIPNPTLCQAIIPEFLNIYNAAMRQPEFPSNLLLYCNQHGNPDPELNLTGAKAHALKPIFEREL